MNQTLPMASPATTKRSSMKEAEMKAASPWTMLTVLSSPASHILSVSS